MAGKQTADVAINDPTMLPPRRRITDVRGAVDDNRSGRHLRDGNDVGKFAHREPSVRLHHFILHHRQHGVPSTETEQPDFKKREKQFEINIDHDSAMNV